MTIQEKISAVWKYIMSIDKIYHIISILGLVIYISLYFTFIGNTKIYNTYTEITNSIFFVSIALSILYMIIKYDGTEILQKRFYSAIKYSLLTIAVIIVLYFLIREITSNTNASIFISYIFQIIAFLGLMYAIYILFSKTGLMNYLKKFSIFNYLKIIPSYLYKGLKYLYNNIKETPAYVVKLLLLQIVFIIGWFLIPYIKNKMIYYDGVLLLGNPVYTNNEKTVSNNKEYKKYRRDLENQNRDVASSKNKGLNYKFALSSWVFINNQGPNTTQTSGDFTPLLRFGDKTSISYNSSLHKFQIKCKTGVQNSEVVYTTNNISLQRWNNIILNYNSGNVDIFLNGKLVSSKKTELPYVRHDSIIVGDKNGVEGGIQNVVYYPSYLNKIQIDWIYNSQK